MAEGIPLSRQRKAAAHMRTTLAPSILFTTTALLTAGLASPALAAVEVPPCCTDTPVKTAPAETTITVADATPITNVSSDAPAGGDHTVVVSETPVAPTGVSLSTSIEIDSGRVFQDQGFNLTQHSVVVGDFTFTHEPTGLYVDAWFARNTRPKDREFDGIVGLKKGDWDGHIGWYELPGKEVWDFKLAYAHQFTDRIGISGYGEVMRGGFRDHVIHVEIDLTLPIGHGWTLDSNLGPSYSTNTGGVTVGWEAGLSHDVGGGTSLRAFVKGYSGVTGTAGIVGIGLHHTFSDIFGRR